MTTTTETTTIPETRPEGLIGTKLAGRVALVTGGTRGIGAAICRSLASQGAAVGAGYSRNAEALDKFKGQIPVRRLGRPEEIARVVHFIAADASSYITGQVWGVNGGLDM